MARDPRLVFRERLRELRLTLGVTQEQFAERAGMNYKHYQEIERGGKTEVRFSTLVKLSRAFGIPLYQLFSDEPAAAVIAEPQGTYKAKQKKPRRKS